MEMTRKPLTLKKACELAKQEFGTSKGLEKDPGRVGYYCMRIGNLYITIHGFSENIKIRVNMAGGYGTCTQFHKPDTLEENFDAEECYSREARQDILNDWIINCGPETCHAAIDRIWDRR